MTTTAAIQYLQQELAESKDDHKRYSAARSLGELSLLSKGESRRKIVDALSRSADKDPDPFVRIEAELAIKKATGRFRRNCQDVLTKRKNAGLDTPLLGKS